MNIDEFKEKLGEYLQYYFSLGNSYTYILQRTKEAELEVNDFKEIDEFDIADLEAFLLYKLGDEKE